MPLYEDEIRSVEGGERPRISRGPPADRVPCSLYKSRFSRRKEAGLPLHIFPLIVGGFRNHLRGVLGGGLTSREARRVVTDVGSNVEGGFRKGPGS